MACSSTLLLRSATAGSRNLLGNASPFPEDLPFHNPWWKGCRKQLPKAPLSAIISQVQRLMRVPCPVGGLAFLTRPQTSSMKRGQTPTMTHETTRRQIALNDSEQERIKEMIAEE